MELDNDHLKQLVCALLSDRLDALECVACFDQLDCFVELELAGKSTAEMLPLVEQHLASCEHCREEYQALREALSALA